jgi:hypothetical protein
VRKGLSCVTPRLWLVLYIGILPFHTIEPSPTTMHFRAPGLITTASQARQRSTGGDPFGLASEARPVP